MSSQPAPAFAPGRADRLAWYMYDWANSPYSTSVLTVFFGPYLTAIAQSAAAPLGSLHVAGLVVPPGALFPYLLSLSLLCHFALLPYLSAIADAKDASKFMLGLFAYAGASATIAMYWVDGDRVMFGSVLFLIANVSWGLSVVFYNSLLSHVARPQDQQAASCSGAAVGYIAGGLMLAAHLLLLAKANSLGTTEAHALRISFSSSGIWWAIFSLAPVPWHSKASLSLTPRKGQLLATISSL